MRTCAAIPSRKVGAEWTTRRHSGAGRCRTSLAPGCAGHPRRRSSSRLRRLSPAPPRRGDRGRGAALGEHRATRPPLEQAWLEEHFDFHALDFEDVLSRNQRPKIDEYDDYLFIVLHFPVFDRAVGRLGAGELDIFVGPGFLGHDPEPAAAAGRVPVRALPPEGGAPRAALLAGSGYLLYRIVDDGFDYCFPMLRKIGNKLDALEDEIFEGRSEEIVRDISNVKQEIINFRKVIRPQRPVLRDLERVKERYLAPEMDLEIYFDDIVDAHERIWDMLENYKEVVEALEDTNESVISHRVNDILRVLTSISVIVLPLTLLASIWGMNVGVPGEGDDPLLGHRRRHGRAADRHGRLLPPPRLAVGADAAKQPRLASWPRPGLCEPSIRWACGQRIWAPWRLEYVKDASKDNEERVHLLRQAGEGRDDAANLIVHRGERCFVILNKFPYTNGHLMVAPYEHVATLPGLDAETVAEMMALAQRAIDALERALRPHGYNVGFNQGRVAGAGRRAPHPHARRPALGRRHQLHAGARRHPGDAADARAELRGAAGFD